MGYERFQDRESWFCASIGDTLWLMEMTVMQDVGLAMQSQ